LFLVRRFSELVALVSVSTTVLLFLHTQILNSRIEEIQGILTASASGASAHASKSEGPEETYKAALKGFPLSA
jgi:hypothetical protein